jgi:hypothetical protein
MISIGRPEKYVKAYPTFRATDYCSPVALVCAYNNIMCQKGHARAIVEEALRMHGITLDIMHREFINDVRLSQLSGNGIPFREYLLPYEKIDAIPENLLVFQKCASYLMPRIAGMTGFINLVAKCMPMTWCKPGQLTPQVMAIKTSILSAEDGVY